MSDVKTDPFAAVSAGAEASAAAGGGVVDDPFGQKPSEIKSSEYPKMDDLDRCLIVVQPSKLEKDLPNTLGKEGDTRDRLTANVTVIDLENPAASKTYEDMYISQGGIIGKTKWAIPVKGMQLGVVRRVRAKNTPDGFNTPDEIDQMIRDWIAKGARGSKPMFAWSLVDYTDAQKAAAMTWYKSKTS